MDNKKVALSVVMFVIVTVVSALMIIWLPAEELVQEIVLTNTVWMIYAFSLLVIDYSMSLKGEQAKKAKRIWHRRLARHGIKVTKESLRKARWKSLLVLLGFNIPGNALACLIPWVWVKVACLLGLWLFTLQIFLRSRVAAGLFTPWNIEQLVRDPDEKSRTLKADYDENVLNLTDFLEECSIQNDDIEGQRAASKKTGA